MNPLTQVKNTQKITAREIASGISEAGSWHAKYKDSAYVFVGGVAFDLTEGDLLAVFAQYGEILDVNLVRDKSTGKSRGFAFLAYEDQKSTVLAVDNLNGAKIAGRIVRVDHVADYKRKAEEDEEEFQKQREANGVCYAFQRGECKRGSSCKYSHDEERNANTGFKQGAEGGPKRGQNRPTMPGRQEPRQMESARSERSQVAPVEEEKRGPQPGKAPSGGGSNPWESGSSLFSIMAEAPDVKLKRVKREEEANGGGNGRVGGDEERRERREMRDRREEGEPRKRKEKREGEAGKREEEEGRKRKKDGRFEERSERRGLEREKDWEGDERRRGEGEKRDRLRDERERESRRDHSRNGGRR